MLTRKECDELAGLIQVIEIFECFGKRDLFRYEYLVNKATEEQVKYATSLAYYVKKKPKFAKKEE